MAERIVLMLMALALSAGGANSLRCFTSGFCATADRWQCCVKCVHVKFAGALSILGWWHIHNTRKDQMGMSVPLHEFWHVWHSKVISAAGAGGVRPHLTIMLRVAKGIHSIQ